MNDTTPAITKGSSMKTKLIRALLLATAVLTTSGQSIQPTPEQVAGLWANFEKADPVAAQEIRLLSNHPELTDAELNELIQRVTMREAAKCFLAPDNRKAR